MTETAKVGFIGGGNMARAIAGGLARSRFDPANLLIGEPDPDRRVLLEREFSTAMVTDDNAAVASDADALVLAVKPQILGTVCRELKRTVQAKKPLVISIAAGPTLADLEAWLGGGLHTVRVMPNQPALIDQGISVLIANPRTDESGRALANRIMSAVGEVIWIGDESLMDAVTAISGTGPAYVYLLIDMMVESAVSLGIDRETAARLVLATARGAALLAESEAEPPAALIERVRSPGGTTTAALEHLEAANVRAIFETAIRAAKDRSRALAESARVADE